jgi:hypothetical protein
MAMRSSRKFFDKSNATDRKVYLKILGGGVFTVILAIFLIISIYWGALWKTPVRPLEGWVIVSTLIIICKHMHCSRLTFQDFDGGVVGRTVVQGLTQNPALAAQSRVKWTLIDARDFPEGLSQVAHAVVEQQTWTAITSTYFFFLLCLLHTPFHSN